MEGSYGFSGLIKSRNLPKPDRIPLGNSGDEFFNTLSSAWQFQSTPPTITYPNTADPGAGITLAFGAAGRHMYKPCPSGDFEVILSVGAHNTYHGMLGINLLDASGNGVGYSPYDNTPGTYTWGVASWVYGSTAAVGYSDNPPALSIGSCWLSLRKVGANVQGRVSYDGRNFSNFNSGVAIGTTPLYVTIGTLYAATTATVRRLNFIFPTYTP